MTDFTVMRPFVTRAKTWGPGEKVDVTRLLPAEVREGLDHGYFVPLGVYGTAAHTSSGVKAGVSDPYTDGVMYIAHRGAPLVYPEGTLEAYRASVAAGCKAIEQDCHVLADGTVAVMHDENLERTTTSTGPVARHTAGSWQQVAVNAGASLGGAYKTTTQRAPLFSDVVTEFGNKVMLVPEAKTVGAGAAIVKALQRGGVSTDSAIVQTFHPGECDAAIAAGYPAMFLTDSADPALMVKLGYTWVGCSAGASADYIKRCVAAGLKVAMWTVNERYIRDWFISCGATAFFSDDPAYLSGDAALRMDTFSSQTWVAGCQATRSNRGAFLKPNYWGIDLRTGGAAWVRHGSLYIPDPTNFTLDADLTINAVSNDSRWVAFWIGETDAPWYDQGPTDTVPHMRGYHLLVKRNDYMAIWRYDGSSGFKGNLTGDVLQGVGITDAHEFSIRIAVTPASVTITQLSGGNPTGAGCTTTDTNHRGRYIAIGTNGTAFGIRNVRLS